jgi:HD-GYP domain-containing protein (c-di-GMP phosphodiesterase class II)
LLLKDAGCSSNAARLCELYGSDDLGVKRDFKTVDNVSYLQLARLVLSHTGLQKNARGKFRRLFDFLRQGEARAAELVQTRCDRGASIARKLGFDDTVAEGIRSLDEHWNGKGRPRGLAGADIPLGSRVALLAQVADVFHQVGGPEAALRELSRRRGTWFDPALVDAFIERAASAELWEGLKSQDIAARVAALEPLGQAVTVDEDKLDQIAEAFADVVDAKSPYTAGHSRRVADYTSMLARRMGLGENRVRWLRRGGLLHDLGKLAVSNAVLDKPGPLDPEEWKQIEAHPRHTEEILAQLLPFAELAAMAGAHHERLDGKGYYKGLSGESISLETRIITVADVFDALTAERPYRAAMSADQALGIMEKMRDTALDPRVLDALRTGGVANL